MVWRYNLPKCPVSPADRGEFMKPTPAQDATTLADVRTVALAICKSRTCEGGSCCQWPANMGRANCNAKNGAYDDAARAAIATLRATSQTPDADDRPHKTMTWDEYTALPLQGWHQVCRDVDGFGGIGIRYMGLSTPSASAGPQAETATKGQTEATQAQHFDLPKGQPAQFTYNGERRVCQCTDCRRLAARPQPQHADGRGAVIEDAIKALTGFFSILRGKSYVRDSYQIEISHGLYNELRDVRDALTRALQQSDGPAK